MPENITNPFGDNLELFHTPAGEAYATLDVNGHRETWSLDSKEFRFLLERHLYHANGKMPSDKKVKDALRDLKGRARFEGNTFPVHFRVAEHDEAIYIDLGDDQWRSVKVTPEGWDVEPQSTVKFRRVSTTRALPLPAQEGNIEELRPFVNVGSDDDWKLLVSFLVSAFRPEGPYPALVISGQQGAAKSTLSRVACALTDPNEAPIRTFPRNEHELFISANNSWVQAFDNLSQVSARNSDALCRLATGGSFVARKLFTDRDEAVFTATRPVILNGIEAVVGHSDLIDRSIMLHLPSLSKSQRRDERSFWQEFEVARPRILGALLDGVSTALRNRDSVELTELPRMADFAKWSCAAAPAFGWTQEEFMDAYQRNIGSANDIALEASPVALGILQLMEYRSVWKGTATQLLAELSPYFDGMPKRECPQTPDKLSRDLRRLEPNLLRAGVTLEFDRKDGGNRDRMIILRKDSDDEPMPPTPSSAPLAVESQSAPSSPETPPEQPSGVPITDLIATFLSTCRHLEANDYFEEAA